MSLDEEDILRIYEAASSGVITEAKEKSLNEVQ